MMIPTHEVKAMIERIRTTTLIRDEAAARVMQSLLSEREWDYDMDAAPRGTQHELDGIVNGKLALIYYDGRPYEYWRRIDFDGHWECTPTAWKHRPQLPESE